MYSLNILSINIWNIVDCYFLSILLWISIVVLWLILAAWLLQVPEAMQVMHDRRNVGKLVLDPAMEPRPRPATPAKEKGKGSKDEAKAKKGKGGEEKKNEEKGAGDAVEKKDEASEDDKKDDIKAIDDSDTPRKYIFLPSVSVLKTKRPTVIVQLIELNQF